MAKKTTLVKEYEKEKKEFTPTWKQVPNNALPIRGTYNNAKGRVNPEMRKLVEEDIIMMLTRGVSQPEIKKEINKCFDISKYQLDKVFDEIKIVNDKEKDIDFQKAVALRRLEYFLDKAIVEKDWRLAKDIQKDITDFLGVAAEKKSTINHTLKPLNQMTDKEIQILIEEDPTKLLNG